MQFDKRFSIMGIILALSFFSWGCSKDKTTGNVFYVSLAGNDSWSGKLPEPNKRGTDGPFATFEKTRDTIRKLKKAGSLPGGSIKILVRKGTYPLTRTFQLTSEDSGTESARITWSSYPGEEVHIIGGKEITGFDPVTDPEILKRFDESCRDKIFQTDLRAQGITEFKGISSRNIGMELFFNSKRMTRARYPNDKWLKIANVPQSGDTLINEGLDRDIGKIPIPRGRHYGRFAYDGDRPKNWLEDNDIWMYGYWVWDWSDQYLKVKKIDKTKHEIFPEEPHHSYGYLKGQRYYFLNILEELDSPGEWYLDRNKEILYFWPPSPVDESETVISTLENEILSLENTSYITVQGIILEAAQGSVIVIKGGTNNEIAGCTVRNCGDMGIIIDEGTHNGVISCDIYETGGNGIQITGGDRKTLTPAGNYATNNHLYNNSRLKRMGRSPISIEGVGNRLTHNLIHDAPHIGIVLDGNDNVIEFCEIHHTQKETGDCGAINFDRDWSKRGNIIRYNYFHDIKPTLKGEGFFETMAIYLDSAASGVTIYGNIFHKIASIAILINGGHDTIVENNIFVACEPSILITAMYSGWAKRYMLGSHRMIEKLEAVRYNQPPYSVKYPTLATILDGDPAIPKGNFFSSNISYGGKWLNIRDGLDFSIVEVKNNLIADHEICTWEKQLNSRKFITYEYGDQEIMTELQKYGNILTDTDPGFVDLANENFNLKEDSPAWKLGFKPIPLDKIGLYLDEYRTTLPAE